MSGAFGTGIPVETCERLFDAARCAESAWNRQPWRFVLGRCADPTYRTLFSALAEDNRVKACTAAALVLAAVRTADDAGKRTRGTEYELGLAVGGLTARARAEGLQVRQYGGFDRAAVRDALAVPDTHDLVTVVGLMWARPGRTRPAVRMSLSDIVFSGRWGTPADLATGKRRSSAESRY
ncbi:nitroreductase family protein [Lentzea flaviverrucosa]|uniref:Nitroreductase n=1 Tax=Lentzea flaviverrucosa TaxID=200379 RepID=A0A1H9HKW7_9PSEU|nr:nitroreductase family protein [Lentzea flaviverrucosa]RDI34555.1 nitroreductase [Lentzea flaviverrucosa]SEQ62963.1 Nitroreductase [Lentzea flaviverrucosa]